MLALLFNLAIGQTKITQAKYYVGNDPEIGKATAISITHSTNISNVAFSADLSSVLTGEHQFQIRVRDSGGSWSFNNYW